MTYMNIILATTTINKKIKGLGVEKCGGSVFCKKIMDNCYGRQLVQMPSYVDLNLCGGGIFFFHPGDSRQNRPSYCYVQFIFVKC